MMAESLLPVCIIYYMVSKPMSNVHFTAVTNYIHYIRQEQPEVPSEQSQQIPLSQQTAANERQWEYGRQKKSHSLTANLNLIQLNPHKIWKKKPTQPNPWMDPAHGQLWGGLRAPDWLYPLPPDRHHGLLNCSSVICLMVFFLFKVFSSLVFHSFLFSSPP